LMPLSWQVPRPIMGTTARFHANSDGPQVSHQGKHLAPTAAFAHDDLPALIHAHQVKHALCDIDPNDAHILLHGTRLLWLNGGDDLSHHSGVLQSLRIGAGPIPLFRCSTSPVVVSTIFATTSQDDYE